MVMSATRRQFLAAAATATLVRPAIAADSRYKVGITTNTIGGWEKDPFVGFREARELGYRYVESFISYFPEYYPDKPKELKKRLDDIGVGVVSFSNGGAPTEMHFEDASKRDKIIADHLRLVRYSKTFACDHLKVNTGPRRPEGTTTADLAAMAETLNELGQRIREEEGIKFGVHAHMWSQFENRSEINYVMQHTDPKNVYFILDTGHINLVGIEPVELAKQLGHRVIEFHLKDTKPETRGGAKRRIERPDMKTDPPFFPLGKGGVDFLALKDHLDKTNWRGWLTVELDSSPFIPPKESARLIKNYIETKLGIPI